ncbi:hypothetical protein Mapa_003243 [Marchantia paleacea]|nr:hypothetical protein Mapa_003243 [Marchantia paleacea]
MSLKQRATKCSGYIPPNQYVPVYSRPLRSSNVRWHEELSPITPKPSFDDPDNTRSRSIQQAVKAWLESSPNSVIGHVRGRSPTDSPRTSQSSSDRAIATPSDGDLDQAFGDATPESPTFQRNKLTPWIDIVGKGGGGGAQPKADDHRPTQTEITSCDQSTEEKPVFLANKFPTNIQAAPAQTDNYSVAVSTAIKTSGVAPESYLKPPRGLEKAMVLYGGGQNALPQKRVTFHCPEGNIDEIRGKELEDFPAPEYEERRFGDEGVNAFRPAMKPIATINESGDENASDNESITEEVNEKSGFISSAVSSPASVFEERRFGGEGMNLIQITGSGEFAAESVYQKGKMKAKPVIESSPPLALPAQDFDPGAENRRPTRYYQSRRTLQPLYETDGAAVSAHPQMATKQEERYEAQSRPVSGASAQFINGGKRDGPTKTAAVVPVPEDSQFNSNFNQEQMPSTPLEGVDLNQMRLAKQPSNRQQTLERVKKEKFHTKAVAWEEAKNSEFLNRYKREETKIMAWEDHKKAKAAVNLKKVEMKLQEKRAKAVEKMENEMAKAHKKAEEKKAIAEAKRAEKAAKAAEEAEIIRQHGRRPLSLFCFTP